MLPNIVVEYLLVSLLCSSYGYLKSVYIHKRSWSFAFDEGRKFLISFLQEPVQQNNVKDRRRRVAREPKFDLLADSSMDPVTFSATPDSMGENSQEI
jgi:hypothetical protein